MELTSSPFMSKWMSSDSGHQNPEEQSASGTVTDEPSSSDSKGGHQMSDQLTTSTPGESQTSASGVGETAGRAFDSARDRLSGQAAKQQTKYVVGLFALVGAGFGITGYLIIDLLASANTPGGQFLSAIFSLALLAIVLLIGPVIAVYSSVRAADGLYDELRTAYLTSFVSNFAGYLVMVLIAVLFIGAAMSSSGGGTGATTQQTAQIASNTVNLDNLLFPMIALSIPVGLVGLGSAYLHRNQRPAADSGGSVHT